MNLAAGVAETANMYHALEERLKAMTGIKASGFNIVAMCLVPGVVIPPKFKVPEFDKYKGTSCPETHLRSYCRKIAAYAENEPLLMHFFQDSLIGAIGKISCQYLGRACWRFFETLPLQYRHGS